MLKVGYSKLRKYRFAEFNNSKHPLMPRKIDEDEYIEINFIDSGSTFNVSLIYLIENEELLAIKKPHETDENTQKLVQREIRNYTNINHRLSPKLYNFSEEEKLTIIFQLLSFINYLHSHEHHFIYRDLKPSNIMIDENKTVVIIDFDRIITKKGQENNESNTINFASVFCAPEISLANFDEKCDIYSIGQMIYYLLNEETPNLSTTTNFKFDEISEIYKKCTNIKPEQRPSIRELIDYFCHFV